MTWAFVSYPNHVSVPFSHQCDRWRLAQARDGGLPFSRFFSKVNQRLEVPLSMRFPLVSHIAVKSWLKRGKLDRRFAALDGLADCVRSCSTSA
jgi:hypothetical protein